MKKVFGKMLALLIVLTVVSTNVTIPVFASQDPVKLDYTRMTAYAEKSVGWAGINVVVDGNVDTEPF